MYGLILNAFGAYPEKAMQRLKVWELWVPEAICVNE